MKNWLILIWPYAVSLGLLVLGGLGIKILIERERTMRNGTPSKLIEQLSFITFPREETQKKFYGPLFVGSLFVLFGLWTLAAIIHQVLGL